MSVTQTIVKGQLDQILEDSIGQQRRLVLTQHSPQGWRTFPSRFLSGSASSQALRVAAPTPGSSSAQPPAPGETLGVTFRLGHKKCMFGATVESFQHSAEEGEVTLRWPNHLQQLQRRVYERAKPPSDAVIAVRFWREETASSSAAQARRVRHGQLEDISVGGMRIKAAQTDEIELGATYRCAFAPRPGKPSLVLDALIRHRQAMDYGRASIGFQFVGLETTVDGQQLLNRLARTVSQFQRARARSRR